MSTRVWTIGIVTLCVALAGTLLGKPVALAQGEDSGYVDVGLILEVPDDIQASNEHELNIIVLNNGSGTAYDVEVVVDVVYPDNDGSHFRSAPMVPLGSTILTRIPGGTIDDTRLRWIVPALGPLQREEVTAKIRHRGFDETGNVIVYDKSSDPHEFFGKVTTSSFESNLHQGDNTDRAWSYNYPTNDNSFREVLGNYSVSVSVDGPVPSPGSTVNFTITAGRANPYPGSAGNALTPPPIDLKVDIALTGGLTVTGTPTYAPTANRADSVIYSNGVFTVGTLNKGKARTNSVTLPVRVASNPIVNEQCLTATITGNPPPGTAPYDDDISDNTAKACLGEPPEGRVVFAAGQSDLFTWYDCSETTVHPCDNSVSLELVALGETAAMEAGSPYAIFDTDSLLVHIADPAGRATSSDSNSDALVWSTGFEAPGTRRDKDRPGIILGDNPRHLDIETTDDNDQWGEPDSSDTYQVGDLQVEVAGPGAVSSWYHDHNDNATSFYGSGANEVIYDGILYLAFRYDIWLEFAVLGTYTVKQTIKADYDDDTTDMTDPTEYTDTGTYTFHVGPLVELEVRDGKGNPGIATDQYAITVVALNNGPDDVVDAEVAIDLTALPAGVTVSDHVVSMGDGAYSAGTWDLGALKTADHRRSAGLPEAATLTLILAGDDAASATATATIANGANYTVCISSDGRTLPHINQTNCASDVATTNAWHTAICVDTADGEVTTTYTTETTCNAATDHEWTANVCASSDDSVRAGRTEAECGGWFQGTVYDYNDGNNTATIAAAPGTAGRGPGVPTLRTPSLHTPAVGVSWSEVDYLHGVPVQDYQVQWSTNGVSGWTQLESDLPFPALFDITVRSGQSRFYRVGAVNAAGVAGPWSQPVVARTVPDRPGAPTEVLATADGGNAIDVSWSAPLDDGGLSITRYEVQWSPDGAGSWRNAGSTADGQTLFFKNSGVTLGTTRYYRVAARNNRGLSAWSDPPVAATTLGGVPGRPSLTARSTDANTINLTWTKPADNGDPITGYEIEWSPDGSANSWALLANKSDTDTTHTDGGLDPGTERHYRIRAVNGIGEGSWSATRSATTRADLPGTPADVSATADGSNAIVVSWFAPLDDGGAPITRYEIQWSPDGTGNWRNAGSTSDGQTLTFRNTGLTLGTTRYYRVAARNSRGLSDWSAPPVSATTLAGVPGRPSLTARATDANTIELTWTKPADNGDPITGYEIEWSPDGSANSWDLLTNKSDTDTMHTDGGLDPVTERYYRIRAVNGTGEGSWSATRSARTSAAPPGEPRLLAEANGQNAIDLWWEPPADDGGAPISQYELQVSTGGGTTYTRLTSLSASARAYTHGGLQPETTRHYQLRARNSAGWGPTSDSVSATTTSSGRPAAPSLTVRSNGQDEIKLSWTVPNDRGSEISGYEVEVSKDGNFWTNLDSIMFTIDTEYTHTGLSAGSTRYYRVRAQNANGYGQWSTTRNVSTDPSAP